LICLNETQTALETFVLVVLPLHLHCGKPGRAVLRLHGYQAAPRMTASGLGCVKMNRPLSHVPPGVRFALTPDISLRRGEPPLRAFKNWRKRATLIQRATRMDSIIAR
jgi:hypothetical protein